MGLLALALAPGIAICLFIYLRDRYNKEPLWILLISFLLGALSLVPAYFIEVYFSNQLDQSGFSGATYHAISAYLVVAFTEELCKFVPLVTYSYSRKSFDEPFDGIVYAVVVGMGFATLENIGYVMQNGWGNGIARMLLSVPAHGTFAVLMGFFVAMAKFNPQRKVIYIFLSLLLPVIFHGTYDFFLFVGNTWLHFLGAVASFIVALRLSFKAIKVKQGYSKAYLEKMAVIHEQQDEPGPTTVI